MGDNKRRTCLTIILLLLGVGAYFYRSFQPSIKRISIDSGSSNQSANIEIESSSILETSDSDLPPTCDFPVYICGEVKSPGIYHLTHASYLYELIDIAGGLTHNADASQINMVYIVDEAQSIHIPSKDSVDRIEDSSILIRAQEEQMHQPKNEDSNHLVNLNEAGMEELCSLPGIGTKTAEKIIDYRNQNGKFSTIEQIMNVPGIGEGKYNQFRDYIIV